jgi:cation transport ATPase
MTTRGAISRILTIRRTASFLEREGTRALLLSAGPLVILWAIEISPQRLPNAPLLEGALAAAVFFFGYKVLVRGFRSVFLDLRPAHDAAASIGAAAGFGSSFLLATLDAAGRLPAALADPRGGPLLLFAPAATLVAARAAVRDIIGPGIEGLRGGGGPSAATRAAGACILGSAAMALGLSLPSVTSATIVDLTKMAMALLAALALDLIPFVRGTVRSLAPPLCEGGPVTPWSMVERAAAADTVLFEKGGVLTSGRPEVDAVHAIEADWRAEDILHLAAVAEYGIQHEIRDAVFRGYKANLRTIPNLKGIRYLPGRGVCASYQGRELCLGNLRLFRESGWPRDTLDLLQEKSRQWSPAGETVLFISLGLEVLGAISLRDPLRAEGETALRSLGKLGMRRAVLSGDTPESLGRLLNAVPGIEIHAGVLPEERLSLLKRWRKEGRKVVAVGTGGFLANCGRAADVSIRWTGPGQEVAAPAGTRTDADRGPSVRTLDGVAGFIASSRRLVALERLGLALVAGYHAAALLLLSGALGPWLGIPPSPAAAAAAAAVAPLGLARVLWRMRPEAGEMGDAVPRTEDSQG